MKTNVFQKAQKYVLENGTDLQKACCRFLSDSTNKQEIQYELGKYQNTDGGWSNGLEIEYTGPVSSPFTAAAALGYILRFNLENTELLSKTIKYLKNTQKENGSWDDSDRILEYQYPPYMGPGIYPEYKTGMILKWLIRLNSQEVEMIDKAKNYLLNIFDSISRKNDFWSAVAYSSAFSLMPEIPEYKKIMEWCMKALMPNEVEIGWQQVRGMIEDDMPIPDRNLYKVIEMIEKEQESDGGWPHQFGTYNRVWSSIFIMRFLNLNID